jgi:hypothetical protein
VPFPFSRQKDVLFNAGPKSMTPPYSLSTDMTLPWPIRACVCELTLPRFPRDPALQERYFLPTLLEFPVTATLSSEGLITNLDFHLETQFTYNGSVTGLAALPATSQRQIIGGLGRCLSRWRFSPALRKGLPVPVLLPLLISIEPNDGSIYKWESSWRVSRGA